MVHIVSEHTGSVLAVFLTERPRVLADKASFHIKYKCIKV